ncbi:hypothetical protein BDP27DRAFT_1335296 [Rhodocollybia butyracea]|uniref:Uncharacterized protein n=1 Tax=Rhodocollybia butyracea TaxID=206335 RepID=A0A9P5PJT8_9AGAR|nr:hypothetical protein BDP27DRAFT_1335296 [Rhodocollybia butyracea]
MELSLESYRIVVKHTHSRADLATLCLVSKGFRRVAERALYNTLYMSEVKKAKRMCETFVGQPRIAALVEALVIAIEKDEQGEDDYDDETEDQEDEMEDDQDELAEALTLSLEKSIGGETSNVQQSISTSMESAPEEDIWPTISRALQNMTSLRHLNILVNESSAPPYQGKLAWILSTCTFRLKSFNSDMSWDEDLVRFLDIQDEIEDLYIGDYDEGQGTEMGEELAEVGSSKGLTDLPQGGGTETEGETTPQVQHSIVSLSSAGHQDPLEPSDTLAFGTPSPLVGEKIKSSQSESGPQPKSSGSPLTISSTALPRLAILECTFSEAAIALVPGRPVSRLKTCFSSTDPATKQAELKVLFEALKKATVSPARGTPITSATSGWRSLDIADAEYEEQFTMDLLKIVVDLTSVGPRQKNVSLKGTLRYLGTLVLPVDGKERLHFYGLLMKLRRLCCVELEVSAWNPSPASIGPVAFRALGNELRLYCPSVTQVVFISIGTAGSESDENGGGTGIGERTTLEWVRGEGVARVDREVMNGMNGLGGGLWRDV